MNAVKMEIIIVSPYIDNLEYIGFSFLILILFYCLGKDLINSLLSFRPKGGILYCSDYYKSRSGRFLA